jgi:hypothetical protein
MGDNNTTSPNKGECRRSKSRDDRAKGSGTGLEAGRDRRWAAARNNGSATVGEGGLTRGEPWEGFYEKVAEWVDRLRFVSAVKRVADLWDAVTADWLGGQDVLPAALEPWFASYSGRGAGRVTREAFAEPYIGDLRGTPRFVTLGLNPGQAVLGFQARDGIFAKAIREAGSYSAWAASQPYLGETWTPVHGRNRYATARLRFARGWLADPDLAPSELLTFELYPWHSTRVTAPILPPKDIVEDFVWQPLAEIPVEFVFAFGKPWLGACQALGLPERGRWGHGGQDFGSPVASRTVVVFELPSGQSAIVLWQSGYAGPPALDDAQRLRERLVAQRSR